MDRKRQHSIWWRGRLLGSLLLVGSLSLAWGQAPRQPPRRGLPLGADILKQAPGAQAQQDAPKPLASEAVVSLTQYRLTLDVEDQDIHAIIEKIASLGNIEVRNIDSIPHRHVSLRFTELPLADGLKRLLRAADAPGYVLWAASHDATRVQRISFLPNEEGAGALGGARTAQRSTVPLVPTPTAPPRTAAATPPPQPSTQPPGQSPEETRSDVAGGGSVFDDLKTNAAARRLLSQMIHPNEQVRERALEGLVRLFREDEKQRTLLEFLEPIMEDLSAEDQSTQENAREEIRKLLTR